MSSSISSWFKKLCLVCVLVVSGNVSEALAENYYVAASNGNDGNRGTFSAPFKTLERGYSVLLPGDTLYVRAGTYPGGYSTMKIPSGSSWSQPVTIKAYQQEKVVLIGLFSQTALQFKSGSQYIIVDGFTIDAKGNGAGIGSGNNSHHIRVMNGEVMHAYSSGIQLAAGTSFFEFINLRVHDNGIKGRSHGFYISTDSHLVKDCEIYRNTGWGIHIFSGAGNKPSNNRIINNKVYNNAVSGVGVEIGIYNGSGNSVINNVVWGNKTGIEVNYGAVNTKVYNNTIYKTAYGIYGAASSGTQIINNLISSSFSFGVVLKATSLSTQLKNNLVYGSGSGKDILNQAPTTTLSKNLSGSNYNPNFQNLGSFDFHLQYGSPAIDAGLWMNEVDKDFDYSLRPKASTHDIGAYEKS